ncbi:unnamed protein product [Parascedosporium putredinis]|uniref:Threonine aspartase n=1 Tax=Parascedosporium putredinis TaxID=1442378 RepID=A0A9P1MET8_9PEZI|nr:unnamed protein product [Parascedosporium putredinis]CAI8001135.1 unnamed protein product [Parascedosporium putredinis]
MTEVSRVVKRGLTRSARRSSPSFKPCQGYISTTFNGHSNIRNPICLAKTLLDKSLEPLSLRRVPPSFLVGQGASRKPRSVDSSAATAESASSVDTYHSGDRPTMVSGFYNEAQSGFLQKTLSCLKTKSSYLGCLHQRMRTDRSVEIYRSVVPESAPTRHKRSFGEYAEQAKDSISDTVGAIAIDSMGRIAAGSSSGGIGMKHRGRVGPAALVRVGSAVIPAHPKDPLGVSVAAVASGTGEHIATTMASQRCAERLIRGSRQGEFGEDLYDGDDHDVLHAFIQEDFMKHPGVQGMTTAGALGIIAVKMSKTAYYFYFGHNTESFALATMGSTDREPQCLMSRLNPDGDTKISVGARRIKRQ